MASKPKRDSLDRLAKVGPLAATRGPEPGITQPSAPDLPQNPVESPHLSIAEAAARLGTGKARLRLALAHEQVADRLIAKRTAGTIASTSGRGVRIPVELLAEIEQLVATLHPPGAVDDAAPEGIARTERKSLVEIETTSGAAMPIHHEAGPGNEPAAAASDSAPNEDSSQEVAPKPEALSAEISAGMPLSLAYERLMEEKDARIADLKEEIDHLRGILEREQSAHARTQTLLSLQAPLPASDEESEAIGDAVPKPAATTSVTVAESIGAAQTRRGFRAWLIRKLDG